MQDLGKHMKNVPYYLKCRCTWKQ